jgi:hypothetical protein
VFFSHASLPKRLYLWTSSELQLVFTTAMVIQHTWIDWMAQRIIINHAQLGGGASDCIRWVSVFGHDLCLLGSTAPTRAPREVSYVCQDHHSGIEALAQLSKRHKMTIVLHVGEGIYHGDGLYPMKASHSPYFLLLEKYAASGWCRR